MQFPCVSFPPWSDISFFPKHFQMLLSLLIFFWIPFPKRHKKNLSSVISNFVYTTELNVILKQRTGLKPQTGKCHKGNSQILENVWPDSWSAKPTWWLEHFINWICGICGQNAVLLTMGRAGKGLILVWDVLTGILHLTWGRDIALFFLGFLNLQLGHGCDPEFHPLGQTYKNERNMEGKIQKWEVQQI